MERQIKLHSLRLAQILELLRFILGQEHTVKAPSPLQRQYFFLPMTLFVIGGGIE